MNAPLKPPATLPANAKAPRRRSLRDQGILRAVMISVVATFSLLAALMLLPWNTSPVTALTDAQMIRELYAEVPNTLVTVRTAGDFVGFIRDRKDCYEASRSFGERIRICGAAYTRGVLQRVHENTRTNPGLPVFMDRIAACPVIFNICRGEEHGTAEQCVARELQCLNFAIESYRYGSRTGRALD